MLLRALLVCLLVPFAALAQDLPDPLSDRVSDFADLLPPDVEARLGDRIQAVREKSGVHVVIVTMNSLAQYGGQGTSIEDYTKGLMNAWGVGDRDRNDGIMILIAKGDRAARIGLGSGYGTADNGKAARVLDTAMVPEFAKGNYAEGVEAGFEETVSQLIDPGLASNSWRSFVPEVSGGALLAGVGILAVLILALREKLGDLLAGYGRCEACGQRGLERSRTVLAAATTETSGHGVIRDYCRSCGHNRERSYSISRISRPSGRSGGGGSSGFGGGRSSGGGATGRW